MGFPKFPSYGEPWEDCPICGECHPRSHMVRHYKKGFLVDPRCSDDLAHDDFMAMAVRGRERPEPAAQPCMDEGISASPCQLTVVPLSFSFPIGGGNGAITVTIPIACTWTATPSVPWVIITAGASGQGPGFITFLVSPNAVTGPERTSTIDIVADRGNSVSVDITQQSPEATPQIGVITWPMIVGPAGEFGDPVSDTTNIRMPTRIRVKWFRIYSPFHVYGGADHTQMFLARNGVATPITVDFTTGSSIDSNVGSEVFEIDDRLGFHTPIDNVGNEYLCLIVYEALEGLFITHVYDDFEAGVFTTADLFGQVGGQGDVKANTTDVVPFDMSLVRMGLDTGEPDAGNLFSSIVQTKLGLVSPTNLGSSVFRPIGIRGASGPVSGTIPAMVGDSTRAYIAWTFGGNPTFFAERVSFSYSFGAPNEKALLYASALSWLHSASTPGLGNFRHPSWVPLGVEGTSFLGDTGVSEAFVQQTWPIRGTFKELRVSLEFLSDSNVLSAPNDATYTFGFRKNGVTVISASTPNNANPKFLTENVTSVHVDGISDKVNFIATASNASTTRPNGSIAIMFIPD